MSGRKKTVGIRNRPPSIALDFGIKEKRTINNNKMNTVIEMSTFIIKSLSMFKSRGLPA